MGVLADAFSSLRRPSVRCCRWPARTNFCVMSSERMLRAEHPRALILTGGSFAQCLQRFRRKPLVVGLSITKVQIGLRPKPRRGLQAVNVRTVSVLAAVARPMSNTGE